MTGMVQYNRARKRLKSVTEGVTLKPKLEVKKQQALKTRALLLWTCIVHYLLMASSAPIYISFVLTGCFGVFLACYLTCSLGVCVFGLFLFLLFFAFYFIKHLHPVRKAPILRNRKITRVPSLNFC